MRPLLSKPNIHERVQQAMASLKVKAISAESLAMIYALPEKTAQRIVREHEGKMQRCIRLAREGYGIDDLVVMAGISEDDARIVVNRFGGRR